MKNVDDIDDDNDDEEFKRGVMKELE